MVNNPVVEKLFREIGPKDKKRAEEKGDCTLKLGPRTGDAAKMEMISSA